MMACAELLAVCLLSANRGPAPRRQPLPIFHDVSTGGAGPLRDPVTPPGVAGTRRSRCCLLRGGHWGAPTMTRGVGRGVLALSVVSCCIMSLCVAAISPLLPLLWLWWLLEPWEELCSC